MDGYEWLDYCAYCIAARVDELGNRVLVEEPEGRGKGEEGGALRSLVRMPDGGDQKIMNSDHLLLSSYG
jgi:hypothetical protein